jgi:hypothetical protein
MNIRDLRFKIEDLRLKKLLLGYGKEVSSVMRPSSEYSGHATNNS